jgi:5-enolpyruvylshikimate-3-phosphate synthase
VRRVNIGASGDRLLISLDVTAHEKKSWFGFGVNATVQIWGKPVLDAQGQILRLTDLSVAVDSSAAFGLLSAAARAAIPYVQKALAEHAAIDLKPFAADALKKVGAVLKDFEKADDDARVSATLTDIRLTGLAFDSHTLRVIGEADGNAHIAISRLPAM